MHACGGYDAAELTHMHRYVDWQHVGRSYLLLTTIQSTTEPPAEAVLGWRFAFEPSSHILHWRRFSSATMRLAGSAGSVPYQDWTGCF